MPDIRNTIEKKPLFIFGDGKQTRDYIHVDDIVSAIYKSMKNKNKYVAHHIGTGVETTINQIIGLITSTFKLHRLEIPKIIYKNIRTGDMKNNYLYIKNTQNKLGWKARTTLEKGIRKTISWYLNTK